MKILISACLLGVCCRYDGQSKANPVILALAGKHELIPVCPEQLGGLPTPRPPSEIREGRVVNSLGLDVMAQYQKGAAETLRLFAFLKADLAILKARSPSCGCGQVYDGSFSSALIPGDGITAQLLKANGIPVLTEESDFHFLMHADSDSDEGRAPTSAL